MRGCGDCQGARATRVTAGGPVDSCLGGEGKTLELSARNQLKGTIKAIELGAVMADVTIDIGSEQTLSSAITRQSVERLGLKVGDQVVAIIKATEVILGKPKA